MTVRPFTAVLPKPTEIGDEIVIKGKLKDNANIFSVNFTLECCPNPPNIAYHFKTIFSESKVVHNFKTVNQWNDEVVDEDTWSEGPGSKFILTFHFSPREIVVYEDECKNYQYSFSHKFDMGDIRAVQVWDDVEYIDEITFRYKNTADNEI